jgi:hypothetical protein
MLVGNLLENDYLKQEDSNRVINIVTWLHGPLRDNG